MKNPSAFHFLPLLALLIFSCKQTADTQEPIQKSEPLFRLLDSSQTGISFSNPLEENLNLNVLMYEYLYNGGGVAVGDLNQDGLDDLYFSSNIGPNQLYLNLGGFKFQDITQESGAIERSGPWKTGTVFADVNGDGLLDIYLCRSGALLPEKRKNELFINQGNNAAGIPQFKEMAADFGLDSENTSTSAAFFDMDLDGDLDLFLLNHNTKSVQNHDVNLTRALLKEKHESGSQLFENQNGKFVEITQKAGISSSSLSYGLGVNVSDINGDGWPDIYVGNDYTMPDYLYINQKNGAFKDQIQTTLDHVSHFSMGNDVADINNDGLLDIFTLDMLPEDNQRQKLLLSPDNFELYQLNVDRGFHHQLMRNMLHLNAGDGTFQEIGQLAGISNTDWSWAALFADLDLDGWKDLFITNGYLRDYNNQDFLKYMDNYVRTKGGQLKREDLLALVKSMSSSNLKNYTFRNRGDLTFENVSQDWGLGQNNNSNGAAYADLDKDGDLDLVINNINSPAMVYQNLASDQKKGNYLKISLIGENPNRYALGAKVKVYSQGMEQLQEQSLYRGFQSSVSPTLIFGIGERAQADSILVEWPGGKSSKALNAAANQEHVFSQKESSAAGSKKSIQTTSIFGKVADFTLPGVQKTNDFKRQPLLSFGISGNGKSTASGDFDGDGVQDLFVGGGPGLSGRVLFGLGNGNLSRLDSSAFFSSRNAEDAAAAAFDADGDSDLDLFVGSGGVHQFQLGDPNLQDRLYLNDGKGKFTLAAEALPSEQFPTGTVLAGDFTGDGVTDLFVGARVNPGQYPTSVGARLWIGDGKGKFTDQTQTIAPEFKNLGMLTSSAMADLNGDGKNELILAGDAMPVTIFSQEGTSWKNTTSTYFEFPQVGFWSDLVVADWDKDGKPELIVGNHGRNSQLFASDTQPLEILYKDFDSNGSTDAILSYYNQGQKYPSPSRDEVLGQVNFLKKRYLDFKAFSEVKMDELFTPEERKDARFIQVNRLETSYFVLGASGKFEAKTLPIQAQFAPVFSSLAGDFDGDGNLDLLIGGNLLDAKLKFGRFDANHGQVFLGDGKGGFKALTSNQTGISLQGEIRGIQRLGDYLAIHLKGKGIYLYRGHLSKESVN